MFWYEPLTCLQQPLVEHLRDHIADCRLHPILGFKRGAGQLPVRGLECPLEVAAHDVLELPRGRVELQ